MFLPSNITLKFGDSGDFVAELQRRLAIVGCFAEDQVNGFYDGGTSGGVSRFQAMHGLHADGVAGPETLRRLNGVIAGDTSSSSDTKQEEEAKKDYAESQQNQWLIDQPQPGLDPSILSPDAGLQPQEPLIAAPAEQPAQPFQHEQAQAQQLAHDHHLLVPPQPAQAQDLASMLLDQLQQPPQHAPQPAQQPPQEHVRPPMVEQPPTASFDPIPTQAQHQAQPPVQPLVEQASQQQAAPHPAQPPVQQPVEPVQAAPQGIIEKTVRFANSMMQKIADYFEAKLPPSVLKEVQAIGNTLASSGIKEAPVPTGPEMEGPSQAPARGPEQQQAPQMQRGN